ncbi:SpoIIE family protein phosphatase [Streptomyces sp. NBC_00316]|uniref:SpoIIE family protein phosphatase n=1 Tax=Streptomyces sp. NBC_00316 TaxID=2975710 RepID=UPI002E2B88A3|nr:SpoIIE family protein phosphatase [Streptomyces sp. NBC_00316]
MARDTGGGQGGDVVAGADVAAGAEVAATAVLDARGVVVRWSPAAERLLGHPAARVLGQPAAQLLGSPVPAAAAAAWRVLRGTPEVRSAVVTARCEDGRLLELVLWAYPSTGPEGPVAAPHWVVLAVEAAQMHRWEGDRAVMEGLFTQSPVGLLVTDTELLCVRRNVALERMTGIPTKDRLGKRIGEALPGLSAEAIEAQMQQVLDTGVPTMDFVHRGRTVADPEHEHVWSTSTFRLQDPSGTVLGLCHAVIDDTARYRAEERAALLNEASLRIGTTLDVTRTAQELADVAVPRLADTVTVDLLDAVMEGDAPRPGPVEDTVTLRRAAFQSTWQGHSRAAYAVGELSPFASSSPQARCMADLEARLVARLDFNADWLLSDARRADGIRAGGAHSLLVVPLAARDVVMGVASFYRWEQPDPFDDEDLTLAGELAARAAVCIDNARRYTRESTASLTLQRRLLPSGLPELHAVEVAAHYRPAGEESDVGGDWFDVIPLSGARVALVVGDVPGHGIHASATMGRLRTAVSTLADLDVPPDELLQHLDDLVVRLAEDDTPAGSAPTGGTVTGTTCLYAVYDPVERRCTLASAGHYPPAVADPDGTVEFPRLAAGPPLGLGGLPFEATELDLADGTVLALYTNGLLQARDPDIDVGLDALRRTLSHPDRPLEHICDQVATTLLPSRPPDDVALLIARTRALGADRVASWDLAADPAVVVDARSLAARKLAEWGLEELTYIVELVVSELVTNAIRYGHPPIRLRLIRDTNLICEVSDSSSTSPHLRRAPADDEGGRGLFLVAQLTQRWGTRYTPDGKTIWTELTPPHAL